MGRSPFDASIAGPTCAARADCDVFQPEEKDLVEPRGLDGGLGEIGWYTSVVKEFAPGAQI